MQVDPNLSEEEVNAQSKSWATIICCVVAVVLILSISLAHNLFAWIN